MEPYSAGYLLGMAMGVPIWGTLLFLLPSWLINGMAGRTLVNGYTFAYAFGMIFSTIFSFTGCVSIITPKPELGLGFAGGVGYMWSLWCKTRSQELNAERAQQQRGMSRGGAPGTPPPTPMETPAYPGFSVKPPIAPVHGPPTRQARPEPPPSQAVQWASTLVALSIAVILMGGLWLATEGLREKHLTVSKPAETKSEIATADDYWAEAKDASSKGDHGTATVRAQMALNSLKKEGRSATEIQSCKELIANSAYKARDYKLALEHFAGLKKSNPKGNYAQTIAVIRQNVWAEQVKPLLAEAELAFSKGDYGRARRSAESATAIAKDHGLSTEPMGSIQSRIRSAEGASASRSADRRREAYLNEVITVRIIPQGTYETMTRREFMARKARGE